MCVAFHVAFDTTPVPVSRDVDRAAGPAGRLVPGSSRSVCGQEVSLVVTTAQIEQGVPASRASPNRIRHKFDFERLINGYSTVYPFDF